MRLNKNNPRLILILIFFGMGILFAELLLHTLLFPAQIEITSFIIIAIFVVMFAVLLNKFISNYAIQEKHITRLRNLNRRTNGLLQRNKVYLAMACDGVHILDKQGNIIDFSHSFATMLGYTHEEAAQLNIRDWEAKIPAERIAEVMYSFSDSSQSFETKYRRKDGSVIDVEINGKWISLPDGDFLYASARDITKRKQMENELHKLATTDFLTQIPTRRVFFNQLSIELERFHRNKNNSVSVIMLDLDHFKMINDTHGHRVGDEVLKFVAGLVRDEIRKVDIVSRLGGEEFGLILTGTSQEMAVHFTNRIRARIEKSPLCTGIKTVSITVSIGITELNENDTDIDEIIDRADQALYLAKKQGRNQVEIYEASKMENNAIRTIEKNTGTYH